MANELIGYIENITANFNGDLRPFSHFFGEIDNLICSMSAGTKLAGEIESVDGLFNGVTGVVGSLSGIIEKEIACNMRSGVLCYGNISGIEANFVASNTIASSLQGTIVAINGVFNDAGDINASFNLTIPAVRGYFTVSKVSIVASLAGKITKPNGYLTSNNGSVGSFDLTLTKVKGNFKGSYRFSNGLSGNIDYVLGEFSDNVFADHTILSYSRGSIQ